MSDNNKENQARVVTAMAVAVEGMTKSVKSFIDKKIHLDKVVTIFDVGHPLLVHTARVTAECTFPQFMGTICKCAGTVASFLSFSSGVVNTLEEVNFSDFKNLVRDGDVRHVFIHHDSGLCSTLKKISEEQKAARELAAGGKERDVQIEKELVEEGDKQAVIERRLKALSDKKPSIDDPVVPPL